MDVMFLLKMIYVWKQYELLNIRNAQNETPLHIATYQNSEDIVANLIVCKADVSLGDAFNNTALHIAVITNAQTTVFEKLLSVDYVNTFIDSENNGMSFDHFHKIVLFINYFRREHCTKPCYRKYQFASCQIAADERSRC